MDARQVATLMLAATLAVSSGCGFVVPRTTASGLALAAAQAAPDAVSLEVFFARFRGGDPRAVEDLWRTADETILPPATRHALNEAGFRAGVVGSQPSAELTALLQLSEPSSDSNDRQVPLEEEPAVHLRVLHTRAGRRNEIVTSHTVDRLPLLSKDQDTVVGRTYQDAECRFDLRATGQADGRVRLSLVPELHHGQPRVLWAGSEGVLRSYTGKPKRTFDEWKLELSLSAGQMLLLAAAPHRPGTLGHHFFTEPIADDVVQKVLVIRPTRATGDLLFAAEP